VKRRPKDKPKQRTLSIRIKAKASFNQLRVDYTNGHVETLMDGVIVDGIEHSSTLVSYARSTKPKILTQIPNPSSVPMMTPYSFIDSFDVIFAVDTNTKEIRGERYSVGAMSVLRIERSRPNYALKVGPAREPLRLNMNMFGALIRAKNCPSNPEPWFWRVAIEDGIRKTYAGYSDSLRIGLVVDSELGRLDEYNTRQVPIHESYLLPQNFTLIYASADSGSSHLLNRLLRLCDKEAAYHLDLIARGLPESNEIHTQLTGEEHHQVPGTPFRF
jgi:hypothetical protein